VGDLRIKNLVVDYSNGSETTRAIDGLDLKVTAGSLVIVLGPSGCGKTSLLSCLGGIFSPTDGCIEFGDVEVTALDRRGLTAYRRHTVGIAFQAFNLVASLTALENVMVPMWAAGWSGRAARERAEELLIRVGLKDRMTRRPGDLSGGQQQRVAVARAIALNPTLILADEPTAYLDFVQAEGVLRLLRDLATGERIVVVATHDTRILPFADRVVELAPSSTSTDREPQTVGLARGSVLVEQSSNGDSSHIASNGEPKGGGEELLKLDRRHYVGEIGPLLRLPHSGVRNNGAVTGDTAQAFRRLLRSAAERRVIEHHEIDIDQGNPADDRRDLADAPLLTEQR
jgi:putative ABC transport system ATP-binding protein